MSRASPTCAPLRPAILLAAGCAFAAAQPARAAQPAPSPRPPPPGQPAPAPPADDRPFVDWYLDHLAGGDASTTDLRQESKVVVHRTVADKFLLGLRQRFGELAPRDQPPAGGANLNDTDYLDTADVLPALLGYGTIPRGSISPKLRLRRYLARDARGDTRPAAITDGLHFLELKMPHPTEPGVALKPRLVVNDRQLGLILDRGRFFEPTTRAAIVATLKADQRNDPAIVDRFVALFEQLHELHRGDRLRSWINTRYVRTAYRVPVRAADGQQVDVQVTVDQELEYRRPKGGARVARYRPGWRAIEVKIPSAYARLPDAELAARGLGDLLELRRLQHDLLAPGHVGPLPQGKGKSGAFSSLPAHHARNLRRPDRWPRDPRAAVARLRRAAARPAPSARR